MKQPPFLEKEEFKEWHKRACEKRKKLLDAADLPDFDEKVWQDFKNNILVPFVGQCAYCEGRYTAGEFSDAEHYRPKGEVTENRNKIAHPGYYWLAYEWHNLLLACKKCNSKHRDWDQAKRTSHPGKLCEFPIAAARITCPSVDPDKWMEELQTEQPMLLNPYHDDPCKHFYAGKEGYIGYKTERGRVTIEVCHLNRKELRRERLIAEEYVKDRATSLWVSSPRVGAEGLYGSDAAFSTYLNCKLKEELKSRASNFMDSVDDLP